MTIDNDHGRDPTGSGDLLGRIRRAHEKELESSDESGPADLDRPPLSDGLREAERSVASEADGAIESGLIGTACEVVDGQYATDDQVREAVVETVVDARYDQMVAGEDRDEIVAAVEATLTRDVTFRAEVETMLIHAARRIGRRQREVQ